MAKSRVFISHCQDNFGPTDYAIRIIDLIGCISVIAEREAKFSRTVSNLVHDTVDSCDSVLIIATPDRNGQNGKEPSQSVLVEIGLVQANARFKGKYFIIKEKNVFLGPMIPEVRYVFDMSNFSPIAEAILIELGSMGFFRNYYELPGSELNIHKLMETLTQLRDLGLKGALKPEFFRQAVEDLIRKSVEECLKGVQ